MSKTGVPDYNLLDKMEKEKMESEYYNISARCHNCGGMQSVSYPKGIQIKTDYSGFLVDVRVAPKCLGDYKLFTCINCGCPTLKECASY